LSLQEGIVSFELSPFGSVLVSAHHAGGVSLAGAGFQVVSAPVPFGFTSSGMEDLIIENKTTMHNTHVHKKSTY
jgi:hypothetical protein